MNIPEEFGKYLLLKKLTEDPLGETFRAGRMGKEDIDQVVLLRVFNGRGMDGEKLWQKVSGRGPVQQALRSPNIGSGTDLGKVRSFPYTAYDYISGKSLAVLLAQAAKQLSPIPTDHALLIAERISLALAAAHETRAQDERIQHGFVVPHLVMISNEGETRLLGFEVAPGLRALAAEGWSAPELLPYLAPETFAGGPLAKSDDVWSLGAVLFELLTGESLPAPSPEGYAAVIDAAMLPNEGTPLPPAIVGLLKKSLVPRDQRITDASTWHKTLSKLMIDGQFSPTTFNLAFFMHNLFRDEIERESQEMQAEKKLELPKFAAVAAPAPLAAGTARPKAGDMRESTGVREATLPGVHPAAASSSKTPLYAGIGAAVLLAAAGGWFFLGRSHPAAPAPANPPLAAAGAQPASMPGGLQPAPAGPSQEEIKTQIQQMVSASSQEMEAKMKSQYEDRIKQLQQQLQDTKKKEDQGGALKQERSSPPVPVAAPPPAQEPATETRTAAKTPEPIPVAPASSTPAPVPVEKTAPQQAAAPAVPVPAPAPARQQIQYGDLVTQASASGVTSPKMTSRLDPRYPAAAQRMNKSAQVDIKVLVDEKGRVLDAQRSGAQAGFGFDEAALEAAKRASFQPASTRDGVRVKMWTVIRVSFQPR
jgi:TonB family protein